ENFYAQYGHVFAGNDPAQEDRLFNDLLQAHMQTAQLQQQLQERHSEDVNQSLAAAFDADPSLAEVYHNLTNANQQSEGARGMARDIWRGGPRAGEALAGLRASNPMLRALRRSDAAPFMPESYRRHHAPGSRAERARGPSWEGDDAYRSDIAQEDDIMNY